MSRRNGLDAALPDDLDELATVTYRYRAQIAATGNQDKVGVVAHHNATTSHTRRCLAAAAATPGRRLSMPRGEHLDGDRLGPGSAYLLPVSPSTGWSLRSAPLPVHTVADHAPVVELLASAAIPDPVVMIMQFPSRRAAPA